jgi:hypothetical protein
MIHLQHVKPGRKRIATTLIIMYVNICLYTTFFGCTTASLAPKPPYRKHQKPKGYLRRRPSQWGVAADRSAEAYSSPSSGPSLLLADLPKFRTPRAGADAPDTQIGPAVGDGGGSRASTHPVHLPTNVSLACAMSQAPTTTFTADPPKGRTFARQGELPKLPIPPLEDTLRRYLNALVGLQDAQEHSRTRAVVEEFLKGDGPRIQEKLVEWAKTKDRWVMDRDLPYTS